MSFSYSMDPDNVTVDAVRLEVGDTEVKQHLLEDEEIAYAFGKEGTVTRAAARCCEMLAARFAKKEDFRGGTIQSNKTNVSRKFREMAKIFRARATTGTNFIMPSMSKDTKTSHEQESDLPQPSFKRDLLKNPSIANKNDADEDLRVTGAT